MSLLILFRATSPPATATPYRALLGVGLVIPLLVLTLGA